MLEDIITNPTVMNLISILGFIITVTSFVLAFYFYIKSKVEKLPVYQQQGKTVLDKSNPNYQLFHAKLNNQELDYVANTRIAFWNNGFMPIYRQDLSDKEPITVKLADEGIFFDAALILSSRDDLNVDLKITDNRKGVMIDFDFLAKDEGCILNLLHSSKQHDKLKITGLIKDSQGIQSIESLHSIAIYYRHFIHRMKTDKEFTKKFSTVFGIVGFIVGFSWSFFLRKSISENIGYSTLPLTLLASAIYFQLSGRKLPRKLYKQYYKA